MSEYEVTVRAPCGSMGYDELKRKARQWLDHHDVPFDVTILFNNKSGTFELTYKVPDVTTALMFKLAWGGI